MLMSVQSIERSKRIIIAPMGWCSPAAPAATTGTAAVVAAFAPFTSVFVPGLAAFFTAIAEFTFTTGRRTIFVSILAAIFTTRFAALRMTFATETTIAARTAIARAATMTAAISSSIATVATAFTTWTLLTRFFGWQA